MNQIQQIVHGMNQGGRYSLNPITFPLSQNNVYAVRARIEQEQNALPSLSPVLARKAAKKIEHALDQLDCIQWQLDK